MARQVKAGDTTNNHKMVGFHLVEDDGITPVTTKEGEQPQASIGGGAWSDSYIGTLGAIGNGRYYAYLTDAAIAAGSLGKRIETRFKDADTAECPGDSMDVVAFDPYDATTFMADVSGVSTFDASSDEVDIGAVKGSAVTAIADFRATTVGLLGDTISSSTFTGSGLATIADAIWGANTTWYMATDSFGLAFAGLVTSAGTILGNVDGLSGWVPATGVVQADIVKVNDAIVVLEDFKATSVVLSLGAINSGAFTESGYTLIRDEVWHAMASTHKQAGSMGEAVSVLALQATSLAIKAKTDLIGSLTVTYSSPVTGDDSVELYGGDDYLTADGRQIQLVISDWSGPDLTDAVGTFRLTPIEDYEAGSSTAGQEVVATIAVDGTTVTVTADMTAEQTAALETKPPDYKRNYIYQFIATTDGDGSIITLAHGKCTVKQKVGAKPA